MRKILSPLSNWQQGSERLCYARGMTGVALYLSIILEELGNGCRVICWKKLLSPDLLAYSQGILGLASSLLNSPTFYFNN